MDSTGRMNFEVRDDAEFIKNVLSACGVTDRREALDWILHGGAATITSPTGANSRQVGGSHYESELQHWDIIERYGVGYLEGCASKYVTRARKKNGLQDVEKCVHYIEKLLELHADGIRLPRGCVPLYDCFRFVELNKLTAAEGAIATILLTWKNSDDLRYARRLAVQLHDDIQSGKAGAAA